MLIFISFLKSLATCLITNSHYTGVYPREIFANGGLLGNVLFFAVSGYCLAKVKMDFIPWYLKRIYRIYPPMATITTLYLVTGLYDYNSHSFGWWYIYPTYYDFLSALLILSVPFFICMKCEFMKKHLTKIMLFLFVCYLIVFYTVFDRGFYHIDDVSSLMIYFLYFECLLLGAYFRFNERTIKLQGHHFVILAISLIGYFGSKLFFVKYQQFSQFQWINQVAIFILLALIFLYAKNANEKLELLPPAFKYVITKLGSLTLEVYLVQFPILVLLRTRYPFPLNWLVLTLSILIAAVLFHMVCQAFYYCFEKMIKFIKNKR